MKNSESIKIEANKTMLLLMLTGSIGFVTIGIWILSNTILNKQLETSLLLYFFGTICIIFFGIISISISNKLLSNKNGILIDKDGIHDFSSGVSAGLILWEDILGYTIQGVAKESFLFIKVKNPEFYINRKSNFISRIAMKANHKFYKTPIHIPARTIKCDLIELKKYIDHYYISYKNKRY